MEFNPDDGWHCPNGHLTFENMKTGNRGCVDLTCEYRMSNLTKAGLPRKRPGRKPGNGTGPKRLAKKTKTGKS